MIRLLVALTFVLCVTPALAASPVKVTADNFVIDEEASLATFTGNVVVSRDGLDLTADKVVVRYGEGGVDDIRSFDATGSVRIVTEGQVAVGSRAEYDPRNQILVMTGNVQVENGSGTLTGPELRVDLKSNTTVFSGGKGGRVTGIFTPQ